MVRMHQWFKDLFIPSRENSYAPQSLQKAAVVGILFLVLLSFSITSVQSLVWVASDWMVSTILPAVLVTDTNTERVAENLQPLTRSAVLDAAAKLKAEDMAKNQYFAHNSPTGVTPWYWFAQAGYSYVHAGENLAVHFTDSGEVVEAWMNSPSHRANIMNGEYREIGIGTAEGTFEGYPTVFVVQLFGTPAAVPTPTPAPTSVAVAAELEPIPVPVVLGEESISDVAVDTPPSSVLAKDVEISESVTIIPAEPEVVTVSETPEGTTVLSLEPVSTSTGGVPATIAPADPKNIVEPGTALRFFVEPQTVLLFLYGVIASFVFVALMLSIIIEVRHQQPLQIAYGTALLLLMGGLLYVQLLITSGGSIV